jgi:hypothetical protein
VKKRLRSDRPTATWRAGGTAAVLALFGLALSGCMSLKESKVVQETPGKVTIRTVLCASNYAAQPWADCQKNNVFAEDNNRKDATDPKSGQLLVGFRVPLSAAGPQSFPSKNGALQFNKSASYTSELQRFFPPAADEQWLGYISTFSSYDPAGAHSLELEPEFTLASSPTGALFTGPFRWRTVAGFREGDAAAPVACGDTGTVSSCFDSPSPSAVTTDIPTPVSDFSLLGAATTTAFAGTTAAVLFKLRYSDSAKLGRKSFSLSAKTELPKASVRAMPATQAASSDTSTDVTAQVQVPANTPAGRYAVTLTGENGSPAVARTATGTIVVEQVPQQKGSSAATLPAVGRVYFDWLGMPAGGTKLTRLVVTGVPARGKVTVRCRGGGCPRAAKAIKRSGTVNMTKRFSGRKLRPHAVVTITIEGPNRIGKQIALTMRKAQKPAKKVRCRPPGTTKTLSCIN